MTALTPTEDRTGPFAALVNRALDTTEWDARAERLADRMAAKIAAGEAYLIKLRAEMAAARTPL